jgi:hypothetical protein
MYVLHDLDSAFLLTAELKDRSRDHLKKMKYRNADWTAVQHSAI